MPDKTRDQILREAANLKRWRTIARKQIKPGNLARIRAPRWTVVRTAVGKERFASNNIQNRIGMRTFLPRCHTGLNGPKLSPLFPGYLFVELPGDQWMALQYSPGVIEVIKENGTAVKLHDAVIYQLLKEQGEDGYIEFATARWMPDEGDAIKIKTGLFKDHVARYIGRDPVMRMQAALEFLGKEITVTVARSQIAQPSLDDLARVSAEQARKKR